MSGFYDDASWVLIPEGIKEDVVYAQKPTNGLGDLTFTRASDATRTNSAGVIERTPWNLATFSEDFSNVAWVKSNATISTNSTTAPNGTLTADTLNVTANIFSGVNQSFANLSGSYTSSIYAKKGTKNWLYFIGVSGNAARSAWFNLDTGAIGTVNAGVTATIENVGNGWYRCTAADTRTGTGTGYFQIGLSDANGSQTPASSGTAFIWGAQLVEGTDAKPYFATTNRQDVPRLDYRNADGSLNSCPRLLLEPQRTNSIRNSTMVGAVAGSPGTLPTNWDNAVSGGLTRTIVAIGVESGITYVDLRFAGTALTDFARIDLETATQITALNAQSWTESLYAKIISAPNPPVNYTQLMIERTSGGSFVTSGSQTFTPTTSLQRFAFTRTLSGGATVAAIQPGIGFGLTNGATYDFTIRIAAPQMELGAYATTFIPTTTAAVTRLADVASKTGVSSLIGQTEGTLFGEVNWGLKPESGSPVVSILTINNNVANIQNSIILGIERQSGGANRVYCLVQVSNVTQAGLFSSNITSGNYKIALGYKQNDFVLYVNGVQIATDPSGSVPTTSQILLGQRFNGDSFVNADGITQAALFPTRLTNAQLAQLTTL
jgi:hypothetical protein